MTSIFKKVYNRDPKDYQEVLSRLNEYFNEYTQVDPETTKFTLGESFNHVTAATLLSASKKLLAINKGTAKPDERDNLIFKKLYSVEDLLAAHFEKQMPVISRKLARSLSLKDQAGEIISSSTFGKPIKEFFTTGDLSATPPQTNPVTIVDAWRKTTPMGTGGIQSRHSITMESRNLQPTHLGYLDSLSTPESGRVGVTVGLASEVEKEGNDMVTPVYTKEGKLQHLKPLGFYNAKVGFPDQYKFIGKKIKAINPTVTVMHKGVLQRVKAAEVDYYLRSPKTMFSFASNLVPFLANTQGNRASTGSRMITQAMSLVDREVPLVQTRRSDGETYEDLLGNYLNPVLGVNTKGKAYKTATVTKIANDYVHLETPGGVKIKRGLYKDFPLNQDGFLNSTTLVQVGDKVTTYQPLAENNYSRGKTLALGKNLVVAYMPYKGYNFEDGAVITESAAEKMSHQMIHKANIFFSPKLTSFDIKKFLA